MKIIKPRAVKKVKKKPSKVIKKIPKMMFSLDPPVISRDPKPMSGMMEFMQRDLKGQAVWKERFFVLENLKFAWYPPSAMTEGYDPSRPVGSIPVEYVWEAHLDSDGYELDLVTDRAMYHFRSRQKGDAPKWQDAIMNTSPPNALKWTKPKEEKKDKGIYEDAEDVTGVMEVKKGGFPFGVMVELLTDHQKGLLEDMFMTISRQNFPFKEKETFDGLDLAKFCVHHVGDDGDMDKVPSMEECEEAVDEACVLVHKSEHDCDLEAFTAAICAPRPKKGDAGSKMAAIIEKLIGTDEEVDIGSVGAGEWSIGQKLHEYHKNLGRVLRSCRDKEDDGKMDPMTKNKIVAESYLNNIVTEVEALIKRHDAYQERLRTLDPTLRARTQHQAVDDVFDFERLPGDRWTVPGGR